MPTPLQTLTLMPEKGGRRFSTVTMGTTQSEIVRDEFMALRRVAALLCGVPPEEVTREHLMGAEGRVIELRMMMRENSDAALQTLREKLTFVPAKGQEARLAFALDLATSAIAVGLGPL